MTTAGNTVFSPMGGPPPLGGDVPGPPTLTLKMARKITAISTSGTIVEYFDLSLASFMGATVWPALFFPKGSFAAAFAASVGVAVGVTYAARPIGAMLFGHFGDRLGRKNSLISTLILGAFGTLMLAFAPSYAGAGMWGIGMVLVARFIFGIAMGGQMGSAVSWITEAAEATGTKRRGLFTGMMAPAASIGVTLCAGLFLLFSQVLSKAAFASWGWRVVVLVGVLVIVIAGAAMVSVVDSPIFTNVKQKKEIRTFPLGDVIKEQWRKLLILPFISVGVTMVTLLSSLFVAGYLESQHVAWFSYTAIYFMSFIGGFFMIAGGLISATYSDRLGRKKTVIIGLIMALVMGIIGVQFLVETKTWAGSLIAIIFFSIPVAVGEGGFYALFAEAFPTRYRQTASGLTYQLSNFWEAIILICIVPTAYVAFGIGGSVWVLVGLVVLCAGLGIGAAIWTRETAGVPLEL